MNDSFKCENCGFLVKTNEYIGTKNRNHCPDCLHSKHVDEKKSGDRDSQCQGIMEPVDITFKKGKVNKYGKEKSGEIMIVHRCKKCKKEDRNRIAGDDDSEKILKLCKNSENIDEVKTQLYGRTKTEL